MNLETKTQNFCYQLESEQLLIPLKQKPACVRSFTKEKTNVIPDNKLFQFETEKYGNISTKDH